MFWKPFCVVGCVLLTLTASQETSSGVCSGPEAYRQEDGHDYRGDVNTTISGLACQKWTSQSPHVHGTIVPDVLNGIDDHNKCRNPGGAPYAGCFTTDSGIRFERCDIGPPCTAPITAAPRTVSYDPPSGVEIKQGDSIALSCLPKPCEMYYTLNGTAPTFKSERYTRPVPAPGAFVGPFLLRSLTVFADGSLRYDHATYVESVTIPKTLASLYPPPNVVYPKPVLVSVLATQDTPPIRVFFQDSIVGEPYKGPFWVYATTKVTAVAGDNVIQATYQVVTSPRLPAFYPSTGTYFGSARIVFIPTVQRETFFVRENGGKWIPVENNLHTITTVGTTFLEVQSYSIDVPASAIEIATITVVPLSPPQCDPPSGTYTKAVTVRCTIGNTSMPVTRLCSGPSSSSKMDCAETASIDLNLPGTFVVSANYYDSNFKPQLAAFQYTLVPRQLDNVQVTPCEGFYTNDLLTTASTVENVTLTFKNASSNVSVSQVNANAALVSISSGKPGPAPFESFSQSRSTMELSPTSAKRCIPTLYPRGADAIASQWMLVPSALGEQNLSQRVAPLLLTADAAVVEVQNMFGKFLLVRARTHPSLSRAYNNRLYRVLANLSAAVGGSVQTEHGLVPADELREKPQAQNVTNEEKSCAKNCSVGQSFALPLCRCVASSLGSAVVTSALSIATTFRSRTVSPIAASPVEVELGWMGTVTNVTAKAVIKAFGCVDIGYPLRFTSPTTATFTPRYAREFTICVDEGRGFHEIASDLPLIVTASVAPITPKLVPCGGTFTSTITINVTGAIIGGKYNIDGQSWLPLAPQIVLPIDSYGNRRVVSVVSQYINPLTGVEALSDSFVCVYTFNNPPAMPEGLSYTFETISKVSPDSHSRVEQARVRLRTPVFNKGDISLAISQGANCSAPLIGTSYTSKTLSSATLASDAGFLLDANLNVTTPFTVCASLNAQPGKLIPLPPKNEALSPLAVLKNMSCGNRCGKDRVCIGESYCACASANGTLELCPAVIEIEEENSSSFTTVLIAIGALSVPIGLGTLLFYAARRYNKNNPQTNIQ